MDEPIRVMKEEGLTAMPDLGPVAWISFDGKLVLDGKDKDPTVKWHPLTYMEDAEIVSKHMAEFHALAGRQNKLISDLHSELLQERIKKAIPVIRGPDWKPHNTKPPIGAMLIGLWFDSDDEDDYEINPCVVAYEETLVGQKRLVWRALPHDYAMEDPPDYWMLAPLAWPKPVPEI